MNIVTTLRGIPERTICNPTRRRSRAIFGAVLALSLALLARPVRGVAATETVLYSFHGNPDGTMPENGVVIGANGTLYGTTLLGGLGEGTVFSLTPPTPSGGGWTEAVILSFGGRNNGGQPSALVIDKRGRLIGSTSIGGEPGDGTVFALVPPARSGEGWFPHILHAFPAFANDGESPGGLLVRKNGTIFGVTGSGGGSTCDNLIDSCGTVFSLTPPTVALTPWTETILHAFSDVATDGYGAGNIVAGKNGVLYGTLSISGGGAAFAPSRVFALTPPTSPGGTWTENIIYTFGLAPDGSNPSGLTVGETGTLYGTTSIGGASGLGTVFQLTPPSAAGGAWTETILYSFAGGSDGTGPGGITVGRDGTLYGVTRAGGGSCFFVDGCGTVFSLKPPAIAGGVWTETILHAFSGGTAGTDDGAFPFGDLIADANGTLYGTTAVGGQFNAGAIFSVTP